MGSTINVECLLGKITLLIQGFLTTIRGAKNMKKNNKKIGAEFERELCQYLYQQGYWTHFINPAPDGSQPFDIIALKKGSALAIDCKTCKTASFPLSRIEDNQETAFMTLYNSGGAACFFAIEHKDCVYLMEAEYLILLKQQGKKSVKIKENAIWSFTLGVN